jgi:STE24 endopeptidase
MDEILRNTFIAVLALTTGIHLWLLKRHINFVSLNKNKVPDAFRKNISLKDHQKAAHYAIEKSELGFKDTIVQASILLLLTVGGLISLISQLFNQVTSPLLKDVAIILSVLFITSLIDLPFSYYKTFFINR